MDVNIVKYLEIVHNSLLVEEVISTITRIEQEHLYLTGGALRNIVWNKLHNYTEEYQIEDFDIVFFNASQIEKKYELWLVEILKETCPTINWSVKNQARMHTRNKHKKYNSIAESLSFFPETSSAIAIDKQWDIIAPFGLTDILNLQLRPTDFCYKNEVNVFYSRMEKKEWKKKWKLLRC